MYKYGSPFSAGQNSGWNAMPKPTQTPFQKSTQNEGLNKGQNSNRNLNQNVDQNTKRDSNVNAKQGITTDTSPKMNNNHSSNSNRNLYTNPNSNLTSGSEVIIDVTVNRSQWNNDDAFDFEVTQKKLQDAILWSEILGKPLSRRRKRRYPCQ
jgi:hypothetical protein